MHPVEIDWLELWRELVTATSQPASPKQSSEYQTHFRRKIRERPDPLLDFILQDIDSQSAALDVGAGSGRWTIPVARVAKGVTAVEPSRAMVSMLSENIAAAELNNIQILQASWEDAIVEPHEIVVCGHAIYFSPDFATFAHKIEKHATKRCYLAVRLPPHDGIIGELSLRIRGNRHDSPNAIIAYNALYSMGIYANVVVEDDIHHWIDPTPEEAFVRAKRHLRLESTNSYDELIRNTLGRRLAYVDKSYVWPDGMRSALLWWSPSAISK